MIDYLTVYLKGENGVLTTKFYSELDSETKFVIEIVYRAIKGEMKRFIIIHDKQKSLIIARVYSVNPKSRKYVEAVCSIEFVLKFDFETVKQAILDAVYATIKKTVELMEVKKSGNKESVTVDEPQQIKFDFSVNKDYEAEDWESFNIKFNEKSRTLCLKISWIDENDIEDSKDYYDGEYRLVIYFPFSGLKYSVVDYTNDKILEEGEIK
jgi:ribosomal protein S10